MRAYLGSIAQWLAATTSGFVTESSVQDGGVKNVAIIGAGAAGASVAYHLQQFAEQEGLAVNITIFEKTDRIGGRTLTVDAFDDPSQPIELGASIFITKNHILYNATQRFDLPHGSPSGSGGGATEEDVDMVNDINSGSSDDNVDDFTVIWDGERFVYQSISGTSWWWSAAKMVLRYGLSPYRATKLVEKTVGSFLRLYEAPYFPFRSLTQRAYELGLEKTTALTGEQFLAENKVSERFGREILQSATRVNYASNLAFIHGLETMVSFATDGALAISTGNWRIFDNMVRHSGASFLQNTSVASISFEKKRWQYSGSSSSKYQLTTTGVNAGTETVEGDSGETSTELYGITFDNVVIACPWQFSDVEAAEGIIKHTIDEIPYTRLHVTLFTSPLRLRPDFFGLEPGAKAPSTVYTTLREGEVPKQGAEGVGPTGFYSISTLRTVINPETKRREFAYKIFSASAITHEFLSDLLGANVPANFVGASGESASPSEEAIKPISWYYPHWFYSYPIELPRVTFQDPIVGSGLYYTSGIESFISTMETSALMGMNVARLIADDFAGVSRVDVDGSVLGARQEEEEAASSEEREHQEDKDKVDEL